MTASLKSFSLLLGVMFIVADCRFPSKWTFPLKIVVSSAKIDLGATTWSHGENILAPQARLKVLWGGTYSKTRGRAN